MLALTWNTMCSLNTCLTHDTVYSVSFSVSCAGFGLLLSTGPYDSNSGTAASCFEYADLTSAADGAGAVDVGALGAGMVCAVSRALGPEASVKNKLKFGYRRQDQTKHTCALLSSLLLADLGDGGGIKRHVIRTRVLNICN